MAWRSDTFMAWRSDTFPQSQPLDWLYSLLI